MQPLQDQIEDSAIFSPSFSCYSSDSTASTAIAKVITEEEAAQFHEIGEDFEFSPVLSDEEVSDSRGWMISPFFNRDRLLVVSDRVDRDIEASSSIACSLADLFVNEREVPSSHSSSEAEESESLRSGSYFEWRPKADGGSSPVVITTDKCKKSSSTGSGTKRWRLRCLLRRSNSEGKEPVAAVLTPKKVDDSKPKRNSGDVVHEQFYLRRRAENEVGKRKSYLPYRKDLVGLMFANVNGIGKMLPF